MSPLPASMRNRRLIRVFSILALSLALGATLGGVAVAKPSPDTPVRTFSTDRLGSRSAEGNASRLAIAGVTPPVGTVRQFLGSDDYNGRLYRKDYVLRVVGTTSEVWVAVDTSFPAGDCRSAVALSTTITDAQATAMAHQFDTVIYPRESAAFSVPPQRDGSNAQLGPDANGNGGDYSGDGNKVVVLVDNIRDDNYYTFPAAPHYNPGFFSSQLNELFDRNVITVDAFDWAHRTTAAPPTAPTADPCTTRPAAPNFYEKTLAREYQRLLQYYVDPNEAVWLSEGLAAYAESLTGYANPKKTVLEKGADRRILCFQGFGTVKGNGNPAPKACGGPQNALTLWGDEGGGDTLLADQGQVWSFVLYLKDRFGAGFVTDVHRADRAGLAGLQQVLDVRAPGTKAPDVVHDFQVAVLVDLVVDNPLGQVRGTDKSRVVSASLNSTLNLADPSAYSRDGVGSNGADSVWLRDARGRYLSGSSLTSLAFAGELTLRPSPLQWTVVSNNPERPGNPVLFSGNTDNLDAYAVIPMTVPTSDPTLRYLAAYGAEFGFDYAYTVVSTDGGATYTPLAGDRTVDGPLGPGLNGTTTGFEPHSFDLSAYAGQSVLLGFRYVTDSGVNEGGISIDDVTVGGTTLSDGSSITPFRSLTQVRPVRTAWTVRLVGIDPLRLRTLVQTYSGPAFTRSKAELAAFKDYPVVVGVVSSDELTEQQSQPAFYRLTVNGAVQPGGGPATG